MIATIPHRKTRWERHFELEWVGIALVWAIIMFLMMSYWLA